MYHYIFLILLQYLYITGYTPFGCPYSFCCCIKFVLNFILFLKLRKLHSSFHLLKVKKLHILNDLSFMKMDYKLIINIQNC